MKDNKESSESITIVEYNKEIDEAIARVEAGEFYSHEDVIKMAKDW
jgi:predicted transcriptional regulator